MSKASVDKAAVGGVTAHAYHEFVMRQTQRKGDIAVAQAIATFTRMGYDVAVPLTESAPYDLVVDTGDVVKRVQVRFTSSQQVDLRRIHSNSSGYVVKRARSGAYDWLYVLKSTGEEFLLRHACRGEDPGIRTTVTRSEFPRRGDRADEGGSLENCWGATSRGFESHPLRVLLY
jgi:hypothetical protein